jgi:hypothetical protein
MSKSICMKPVRNAVNGASRGACTRPIGHFGPCVSKTCSGCGVNLTEINSRIAAPGAYQTRCLHCRRIEHRRWRGGKAMNQQEAGWSHLFPCGCAGFLPARGSSNKFAFSHRGTAFKCRVTRILRGSRASAKRHNFTAVAKDTPHSIIRKLMDEPNCERCGEPLSWDVLTGPETTPHLHHDHETGEIYGFTHPKCNPKAMEYEIDRLRKENERLRLSVAA